jgi:TetR/AcrR family transcriptional repressor of nem operon
MPREKDFDQASVLKKCTALFAANGYSATGIQEIVNTTGINRSSLYSTFKGKEELFLSCLKNVMQEESALLEDLEKKGHSATKLIDAYILLVIKDKPGYHLLKFANAEFKLLNKKTQTVLNNHYQWRFNFFERLLQHAQKADKLTKKIEVKDMVALLELMVQGIQNLSPLALADKSYKKSILQFSAMIHKKK